MFRHRGVTNFSGVPPIPMHLKRATMYNGFTITYASLTNQMILIKGVLLIEGFKVKHTQFITPLVNYVFISQVEARKAIDLCVLAQGNSTELQNLLDYYHIGYGLL